MASQRKNYALKRFPPHCANRLIVYMKQGYLYLYHRKSLRVVEGAIKLRALSASSSRVLKLPSNKVASSIEKVLWIQFHEFYQHCFPFAWLNNIVSRKEYEWNGYRFSGIARERAAASFSNSYDKKNKINASSCVHPWTKSGQILPRE